MRLWMATESHSGCSPGAPPCWRWRGCAGDRVPRRGGSVCGNNWRGGRNVAMTGEEAQHELCYLQGRNYRLGPAWHPDWQGCWSEMERDWQVDMGWYGQQGLHSLRSTVITARTTSQEDESIITIRQTRLLVLSWLEFAWSWEPGELFADCDSLREENQFTSYQDLVRD